MKHICYYMLEMTLLWSENVSYLNKTEDEKQAHFSDAPNGIQQKLTVFKWVF